MDQKRYLKKVQKECVQMMLFYQMKYMNNLNNINSDQSNENITFDNSLIISTLSFLILNKKWKFQNIV